MARISIKIPKAFSDFAKRDGGRSVNSLAQVAFAEYLARHPDPPSPPTTTSKERKTHQKNPVNAGKKRDR